MSTIKVATSILKNMKATLDVSFSEFSKIVDDEKIKLSEDDILAACGVLQAFLNPIINEKAIKEMAMAVDYEGWSPAESLKLFIAYNYKKTAKEISEKITMALTLFAVRGSNFENDKIITRSRDPEKAKTMVDACRDLGLRVRSEGKNFMTLPRLSALFPVHMAAVCSIVKDKVAEHGLPALYCFPHSPVLMEDTEWEKHKDAYFTWMFHLNKRINSGKNGNKARRNQDFSDFKSSQESIVLSMKSGTIYTTMKNDWISNAIAIRDK